jgi:thiamine kinase
LQIESAIATWQLWNADLHTPPVIIGPMQGGRSNQSFLLDSDGKRMVLRLNDNDQALPPDTRLREADSWKVASAEGIAPPLVHVDIQSGFLVSSFIENTLDPQLQPSNKEIDQAFNLLKRCHRLPHDTPLLDYVSHIENYWRIIDASAITPDTNLHHQRSPMQSLLEALLNNNPQTGFCHHDPVRTNFVGDEQRLYLIDWEYAAQGLVVMDYAALGTEWGIEDSVVLAQSAVSAESLNMAKQLYRYLCDLWEVVSRVRRD